jgi:hypothetical protein
MGGAVSSNDDPTWARLEGIQQLHQYQQNWVTYWSTSESLSHE